MLSASRLESVVFQTIGNQEDSRKALAAFEPFKRQSCLVVVKQEFGSTMASGIVVDNRHVLTAAHAVLNAENIYIVPREQIELKPSAKAFDAAKTWKHNKDQRMAVQKTFSLATFEPADYPMRVVPTSSDFGDIKATFAKHKADQENFEMQFKEGMAQGWTEVSGRSFKRSGPDIALLRLKNPVDADTLWDKVPADKNILPQNPVVLGFDTEVSSADGKTEGPFQKQDGTSLAALRVLAQPPVRMFEGPAHSKRAFCFSTYQSLHSKEGQFSLTTAEAAAAPKYFGMATEGCAGGPLLGKVGEELCLLGIVSSVYRSQVLDQINLMSTLSVPGASTMTKAIEARDAAGMWPVYQVSERITPQIKGLLQDVAADRVAKKDIPATWAAL